jgi:hypothetical protein
VLRVVEENQENEAFSSNHCCRGKTKIVTYFCVRVGQCMPVRVCLHMCRCGCMSAVYSFARVTLIIQHVTPMCHIFCGLSGCTIFSTVTEHKMCVLIFSTTFV